MGLGFYKTTFYGLIESLFGLRVTHVKKTKIQSYPGFQELMRSRAYLKVRETCSGYG